VKPRLIIDMDDILADTSARILEIFNAANGLNLDKAYFEDKNFYELVHSGNYTSYRDALYQPGFFLDLPVFEDAVVSVQALQEKYEIFIVSAATEFPNSLGEKMLWLEKHFPFIGWQNIVFCGDKSIVHGDIMIDDHARNFAHFSGRKMLFHSLHNTQVEGFERVRTWKDIYELLK
jgi:5'-nucleotidase